jgi:hypothetical protein
MVISYRHNCDFRHLIPIQAAIILYRLWVVVRLDQKSIRMHKVKSEFACQIADQFVAPAWKCPHYFEIGSGL